jgi:hypothetical protein
VLTAASLGEHASSGRHLLLDTVRNLQAKGDSSSSRAVGEPLLDRWRLSLGADHPDVLGRQQPYPLPVLGG